MRFLCISACFLVAFVAFSSAQEDSSNSEEDYYDYNYDDEEYSDTDEFQSQPTTTSTQPSTERIKEESIERFEPGFRAEVTCSSVFMTMTIDRRALPTGLGFPDSIPEDAAARGDYGPMSCIKISHNSSHYIYKVEMICRRAVGILRQDNKSIYTHEFLLDDTRTRGRLSPSKPYSIIMDCVMSSSRSRDVDDWSSVYRVFEHREGRLCSAECPHEDLCIPDADLNGYFCSCTTSSLRCDCPDDFYGCSGSLNGTRDKICIRNDVLCDSKHDCPLDDDEECSDTFDSWSHWSSCSATCGDGTETRQRNCQRTFNKGTSRSLKPCLHSPETEIQTRACSLGSCSSVECGTDAMMIDIPMEFGMTPESVKEKMHLKNARKNGNCLPQINGSFVKFVIPLHECNTTTWVDGDVVYYSNVVLYETDSETSAIIVREYGHSYTAKCQYKRRQTISLRRYESTDVDEVAVLEFDQDKVESLSRAADSLDMITHYSSGDGVFEYMMDIYTDNSFTTRYTRDDYPLQKRLGERIFIAINFKSQDEDLNVFIERCWAMSSIETEDENGDATYLFINGGCPIDSTVKFHNGATSQFSDRYSIESFKFNDAQYSFIYFRCDVIVCDASEDDPACERDCITSGRRRKRAASSSHHSRSRVTQGPIVILDESDQVNPNQWRSEVSIGSVDHEIITSKNAHRQNSNGADFKGHDRIILSPFALAAIVGSICLTVGLSVGIMVRRTNTATSKQRRKSCEKNLTTSNREEEANVAMLTEDC